MTYRTGVGPVVDVYIYGPINSGQMPGNGGVAKSIMHRKYQ
jgi:hypothetical protein